MDRDDPPTEELRIEQSVREREERRAAEESPAAEEAATHDRRADRAAYLRSKLDEQAASLEEE